MLNLILSRIWGESPPLPRVNFITGSFTQNVEEAAVGHGRGKEFIFPNTPLGRIQALYVGSWHGWDSPVISDDKGVTYKWWYKRDANGKSSIRWQNASGVHIHLSGSERDHLSTPDIAKIKDYWRDTFGKELTAVVTINDINDRDVSDMRGEFGYFNPHSVSVGDQVQIGPAFWAGSTFRHEARSKKIVYLWFDGAKVQEVYSEKRTWLRPVV